MENVNSPYYFVSEGITEYSLTDIPYFVYEVFISDSAYVREFLLTVLLGSLCLKNPRITDIE